MSRPVATIAAADLPAPLLGTWKVWMATPEPSDGGYYRVGDLDTMLRAFETSHGLVYVDGGGGGMLLAEACDALNEFETQTGFDGYGRSCIEGTLTAP